MDFFYCQELESSTDYFWSKTILIGTPQPNTIYQSLLVVINNDLTRPTDHNSTSDRPELDLPIRPDRPDQTPTEQPDLKPPTKSIKVS